MSTTNPDSSRGRIAVLTDSTCDIPPSMLAEISVIPNIIVMDGQEYQDGEGAGAGIGVHSLAGRPEQVITRSEFYRRMPALHQPPTTATPAVAAYEAAYSRLLDRGAPAVISIHPARQLAGIFNAASLAARSFNGRVLVYDSGSLSMGVGYLALAAAQAAEHTTDLSAVQTIVEETRRRLHVMAVFKTLEYIRRSGRVSWATAGIGKLLGLHPFIELKDGKVISHGGARSQHKSHLRLSEMLDALGPLDSICILHTNDEAQARQFRELLGARIPEPLAYINATTVIGLHVGPNGVGFAALSGKIPAP